ncbi:MAG: cytochrome c oxidase subunit II [Anaerolineales bacterium]
MPFNNSPFAPVSEFARAISGLFSLTLVIGGAIFLLVLLLVVYAAIRFRSRGEGGYPAQVMGRRKLEIAWTVAPGLLLVGLFALTVRVMVIADPSHPAGDTPDMEIIAHQWWWEVRYPSSRAVTANEIHIPVGKRMLVRLESADVIHDFWVPQLGRKMDATPGHPTTFWLAADVPGTYLGTCAEFCGLQHANMHIRVIAESPEAFNQWIEDQVAIPPAPTDGKTAQGAELFQQLPCSNCHTIAGTDAGGDIGPDLTHVSQRQTLGAGVIENSTANLVAWIRDPQGIKPGINMPDLHLSSEQIDELVAYLEANK